MSEVNIIKSNLDNLGNSLQSYVNAEQKLGTSILHYMNDSGVMDLKINNLNNIVEKSEEKTLTVWSCSSEEKTLTQKKVKKRNGNDIVRSQLLGENPNITLWNLVNKSLTIINNYLFVNTETLDNFNPLDMYREDSGEFTEIGLNALKEASSNDKKEYKPEQNDEEKAKLDQEKQDKWKENFTSKLDYLKSETLERGLDQEWFKISLEEYASELISEFPEVEDKSEKQAS